MWSAWMEVTGTKHKRKNFVSSLMNFSSSYFSVLLSCPINGTIVMSHNTEQSSLREPLSKSLNRRLWLLVDPIRRWVYVYMISRCLRAMMMLIRRMINISRSIEHIYANLYFFFSLYVWRSANAKTMIISTVLFHLQYTT